MQKIFDSKVDNILFEKDISVEMLKKAEKIALLNAMIGMYILKDYSFLS